MQLSVKMKLHCIMNIRYYLHISQTLALVLHFTQTCHTLILGLSIYRYLCTWVRYVICGWVSGYTHYQACPEIKEVRWITEVCLHALTVVWAHVIVVITNWMSTTDGAIDQYLSYDCKWIYYCLLPKTIMQMKHLSSAKFS